MLTSDLIANTVVFGTHYLQHTMSENDTYFILCRSKLWIGTTNGSVLVKSPENWDRDEGPLNPYTGPVDSSELICMFIVSSSSRDLQNFAWTYNYQGMYKELLYYYLNTPMQ